MVTIKFVFVAYAQCLLILNYSDFRIFFLVFLIFIKNDLIMSYVNIFILVSIEVGVARSHN